MNVTHMVLIPLIVFVMFTVSGCKWRDDFRDRLQPEYQEREVKKTLNADSDDYIGDAYITGKSPDDPELESIDDLSDMPELPDQPVPMP